MNNELFKPQGLIQKADRRKFLKMGSLTVAGAGLLLMGCNDEDNMMPYIS